MVADKMLAFIDKLAQNQTISVDVASIIKAAIERSRAELG